MWKFAALAMIGLSGCVSSTSQPVIPIEPRDYDVGHGVGYESYEAARLEHDRGYGDASTAEPGSERVISSEELAAAGLPVARGRLPAAESVTSAPLDALTPAEAPESGRRSQIGISDEQSFEAVSARETIESDAERLARQAEAYRVIPPEPVPTRSGASGPNIVSFALSTDNAVGEPRYSRGGIGLPGRARRACANYASADLAQEAFLEEGGPQKDRLGVDPDGDGFACAWDPAPFRAARG